MSRAPAELFEKEEELTAMGLDIPTAVKIKKDLAKKGIDLQGTIVNENDLEKAIVNAYNSKRVDKNTIDDNLIGGGEEA